MKKPLQEAGFEEKGGMRGGVWLGVAGSEAGGRGMYGRAGCMPKTGVVGYEGRHPVKAEGMTGG